MTTSRDYHDNIQRFRKMNYDYYHNNKEAILEKNRRIREERRAWLDEYKKTLSCIRCGENHPAALVFHHRDPAQKDFSIGSKVYHLSTKALLEEIKKCDVLCSNCHLILHWEEKRNDAVGIGTIQESDAPPCCSTSQRRNHRRGAHSAVVGDHRLRYTHGRGDSEVRGCPD